MSDEKVDLFEAYTHPETLLLKRIGKLEADRKALLAALNDIAAWDDKGANMRLEKTGSYGAFDEPGAVQTAREAIAKVKP